MEEGDGDNVLEAIFDDETLDQDAEMLDAETLEEDDDQPILSVESTQINGGEGDSAAKQESLGRSSKRRANRKKRRNKKKGSVDNVTDINRFVIDTCRHLKEKKSYLIWNAVGCLGMSAVRDLIKECSQCIVGYLIHTTFTSEKVQITRRKTRLGASCFIFFISHTLNISSPHQEQFIVKLINIPFNFSQFLNALPSMNILFGQECGSSAFYWTILIFFQLMRSLKNPVFSSYSLNLHDAD